MMFKSIRWQLVFSYMFLTLLTVAVVGSVTYQIVSHSLQQRQIAGLRANAQAIAQQAYPHLWPVVRPYQLSQLAQTAAFLGDVRVRIYDVNDHLVVDSGSPGEGPEVMMVLPYGGFGDLPTLDTAFPLVTLHRFEEGLIGELDIPFSKDLPPGMNITIIQRSGDPWSGGYTFREWISPDEFHLSMEPGNLETLRAETSVDSLIGGADSPQGMVKLSAPPDYGAGVMSQLRQALFYGGGGAVLLAGLVGLWISHRLASPLKSLANTAAEMGTGDLSVRAGIQSRDEIGALAAQFNVMADRLESNFYLLENERDTLRRFIADASHELRTPMTALKNFNTLLQESAAVDPEAQAEFLEESRLQIERLEWITANLLDLSRLDGGLLELNFEDHDLRDIMDSVIIAFKPQAADVEVEIITNLPPDECRLSCDRHRMEIALSNILDNAVKYTPAGGQVEIRVESHDGIQVWVRDSGVGIDPEDLPHVFERFYRGRGQEAAGSGLGLAIVKSIVEAHHGQVTAESQLGHGTTIRLTWPAESHRGPNTLS